MKSTEEETPLEGVNRATLFPTPHVSVTPTREPPMPTAKQRGGVYSPGDSVSSVVGNGPDPGLSSETAVLRPLSPLVPSNGSSGEFAFAAAPKLRGLWVPGLLNESLVHLGPPPVLPNLASVPGSACVPVVQEAPQQMRHPSPQPPVQQRIGRSNYYSRQNACPLTAPVPQQFPVAANQTRSQSRSSLSRCQAQYAYQHIQQEQQSSTSRWQQQQKQQEQHDHGSSTDGGKTLQAHQLTSSDLPCQHLKQEFYDRDLNALIQPADISITQKQSTDLPSPITLQKVFRTPASTLASATSGRTVIDPTPALAKPAPQAMQQAVLGLMPSTAPSPTVEQAPVPAPVPSLAPETTSSPAPALTSTLSRLPLTVAAESATATATATEAPTAADLATAVSPVFSAEANTAKATTSIGAEHLPAEASLDYFHQADSKSSLDFHLLESPQQGQLESRHLSFWPTLRLRNVDPAKVWEHPQKANVIVGANVKEARGFPAKTELSAGQLAHDGYSDYDALSVADLKLEIQRRGLDCVFCFSRQDLLSRLHEADALSQRSATPQRSVARWLSLPEEADAVVEPGGLVSLEEAENILQLDQTLSFPLR